jgi:hypothetical protein
MTDRHIELSGIKKRKRNTPGKRPLILTARFNEQEKAALSEKAAHAGMTKSAFIRFAALGTPPPRGQRVPTIEHQAMAEFLATAARVVDAAHASNTEYSRVNNNVNQIAHQLNAGRPPERMLNIIEQVLEEHREARKRHEEIMRGMLELRSLGLQALGLERPDDPADMEERAA